MKQKVYTSLCITRKLRNKLNLCAENLGVDICQLLSVLSYKAGKHVCKNVKLFHVIDYQERGKDYMIMPVYFYAADHEYMHSKRLACKVSVSKILACAMELFLDEIMKKGINQFELGQLQIIQNSYKQKKYKFRNFIVNIVNNDQFEKYEMSIKMKKHRT